MNLQPNKEYITKNGRVVRVMHDCLNYPGWVTTYQGRWYEKRTGKLIMGLEPVDSEWNIDGPATLVYRIKTWMTELLGTD